MTTDEIKSLKKKLPRGWTTSLAKMAGVSEITVYKVFTGKSTNASVIDAAIRLIEEDQQRQAKIQKIINT